MPIRHLFPKSTERTAWFVAILSLVPFILPGPLAPLLTYHPWWDPIKLPWIEDARFPVTAAFLILGFIIAIWRHFPRWSYLYSLYILFVIPGGLIYLINDRFYKIGPAMQGNLLILLVLLLTIATPFLRFLRPFFSKIRQDWTLLSFALYACTFFLLSTNDMDESPVYNLQVLLPSLITWLGALAYLLLVDPFHKVGALLVAQLLGVSIWWFPVIIGNSGSLLGFFAVSGILLIYWMILAGLVIAPILINVSTRTRSETIS